MLGDEFVWRQITERLMRSVFVVVDSPSLDPLLCIVKR